MRIDQRHGSVAGSRHSTPPRHCASCFSRGRNSFCTKPETAASRRGSALKAGWMSKPTGPPGQGAPPSQRRIGVGDVDDARQVADQRLQRARAAWQSSAAARASAPRAIRPAMPITPLRRNSARSVALSTMTSATRPEKSMSLAPIGQQHQVERAVGLPLLRGGECFAQFGELGVDAAGAAGRWCWSPGIRGRAGCRTGRRRWWRRCRPAADRSPRCADSAPRAPARCGSGSCTASDGRRR